MPRFISCDIEPLSVYNSEVEKQLECDELTYVYILSTFATNNYGFLPYHENHMKEVYKYTSAIKNNRQLRTTFFNDPKYKILLAALPYDWSSFNQREKVDISVALHGKYKHRDW